MPSLNPLTGKNPSAGPRAGKDAGKIDRLEKPIDIDDSMDIRLEPDVKRQDVLTVTGLSKSFDSQTCSRT
ncbi:MAG: hypothetical protein ACLUKO_09970 [Enterocloster bolteae]